MSLNSNMAELNINNDTTDSTNATLGGLDDLSQLTDSWSAFRQYKELEPICVSQLPLQKRPNRALYPEMETYYARLVTFERLTQYFSQSVAELARSGFFYSGPRDTVCCFYCGVRINKWGKDDIADIEHVRWMNYDTRNRRFSPLW